MGRAGKTYRLPGCGAYADIPTRAFRCMCCMLIAGPVLLGVASLLLTQLNDRNQLVVQYNRDVANWVAPTTSPADPFLRSGSWDVYTNPGVFRINTSVTPDFPAVAAAPDVRTYNRMAKFQSQQPVLPARGQPVPWPNDPSEVYQSMAVITNASGTPRTVASDTIRVAYIETRRYQCAAGHGRGANPLTQDCPASCAADKGYWEKSALACQIYWVLTEVCLVVSAENPSVLSAENDGCSYDSRSGTLRRYGYTQTTQGVEVHFKNVTLGIRSEADPWVQAGLLTTGTFDFGNTMAYGSAVALYVLGALFAGGPCVLLVVFVRRRRQRLKAAGVDPDTPYGTSWKSYPSPGRRGHRKGRHKHRDRRAPGGSPEAGLLHGDAADGAAVDAGADGHLRGGHRHGRKGRRGSAGDAPALAGRPTGPGGHSGAFVPSDGGPYNPTSESESETEAGGRIRRGRRGRKHHQPPRHGSLSSGLKYSEGAGGSDAAAI